MGDNAKVKVFFYHIVSFLGFSMWLRKDQFDILVQSYGLLKFGNFGGILQWLHTSGHKTEVQAHVAGSKRVLTGFYWHWCVVCIGM